MTFQELKTMRALLNDSIANFKARNEFYDDDDIDTLCMYVSNVFWELFGKKNLNKKGFCFLISNSIRKSF